MPQTQHLEDPVYLIDEELLPESDASLPVMRFRGTALLLLCWRRRGLVGWVCGIVLLLTITYLFLRTPRYASTTMLMPPDGASSTSSLMSLLSSTPGGVASASNLFPGIKTPGAIFVGILQSRTAQEALVQRFTLLDHYRLKHAEDACRTLSGSTAIIENPKNGIVSITVEDRDPVLAARLAAAYVDVLDTIVTRNSTSSAHRERVFLEGRINEVKNDLDESARSLSQFSSKNRTMDLQSQAKAMVEASLKLQSELVGARSEMAGLRQTYSENNVRVAVAEARVGELERQIARINGASPGTSATIDGTGSYPSASALPQLGATFADLQRHVVLKEAVWAALTKQYETAKVQEAKEIPTVRVLDAANIPYRQSSLGKASVLLIGFFVAGFGSIAAVLLAQWWSSLTEQDGPRMLVEEILGRRRGR